MDILKILNGLKEAGLRQSEIAAAIGISQPTVSDMVNKKIGQKKPSYRVVVGLQGLAKKHCPHVLAEVANNSIKKDKKQSK